MANTTIIKHRTEPVPHSPLKKTLWFIALWCVGVAGAMLLALPFKLLIQMAH